MAFNSLSRRNTEPRRVLAEKLKQLARCGDSFTVDDLWHDVRVPPESQQLGLKAQDCCADFRPTIGRATVFRSVEKLVDMEVLDRIDFADGTRRYRVCGGGHHHHLACTTCHRIVEFTICIPERELAVIAQHHHFTIEGHSLTIYGRCEECAKTSPD